MTLFETRIGFLQYFLAGLGCFYIIPISYWCFYANSDNDLGLIVLGIAFLILGIVQFTFALKSFHLYSDHLIVKRPMSLFKRESKFHKNEIENITFGQSTSTIGGGTYIAVKTKNSEQRFNLSHSAKTIKEFAAKLNEIGIATTVTLKMEQLSKCNTLLTIIVTITVSVVGRISGYQ